MSSQGFAGPFVGCSFFSLLHRWPSRAQEYGVFMRVADLPRGSVAEVSQRAEEAVELERGGLFWLPTTPASTRSDCSYSGSGPGGGLARVHPGRNVPGAPRRLRRTPPRSRFSKMSWVSMWLP